LGLRLKYELKSMEIFKSLYQEHQTYTQLPDAEDSPRHAVADNRVLAVQTWFWLWGVAEPSP